MVRVYYKFLILGIKAKGLESARPEHVPALVVKVLSNTVDVGMRRLVDFVKWETIKSPIRIGHYCLFNKLALRWQECRLLTQFSNMLMPMNML